MLKVTLLKFLAFLAGLVFGAFPPELIAILIQPNPDASRSWAGPGQQAHGAARFAVASRPPRRHHRVHRGRRRHSP